MSALSHRVAGSTMALLLSAVAVPLSHAQPAADSSPRPRVGKHVEHATDGVWIPGFWDLRGDPHTAPRGGWVYVPGQWVTPPVAGARWVPGDWGYSADPWSWTPGHWELPS
jgi:hypothetical protein